MINIFDLSAGMPGTKMLTDKPHSECSPNRNRHDTVKKPSDPITSQIEDKAVVREIKKGSSRKKSGGTPMKMLIAQEMSRETNSKQSPPSVVAKLMGLDTLPPQQQGFFTKQNLQEGYPCNSMTRAHQDSRQIDDRCFSNYLAHENDYIDVFEVWQQPSRINQSKDQSPQKGRFNDNQHEKRMALVRQKFMEAKRLSTDVKLLQSKEFQDALEVLSSNKDLFLKFLEEPNSLFSKQLNELHTVHSLPQTKRITILKPSKTTGMKDEKQVKKQLYGAAVEVLGRETDKLYRSSSLGSLKTENLSQPTRIVVLKPSPVKRIDARTVFLSPISSPKLSDTQIICNGPEGDEDVSSREVASEITCQMRESFSNHQRDESMLSSVFSNGYIGDESSFNRSENEYIEEDGNYSDSDITTPTSRHSWDCVNNRFESPYTQSSFSHASYFPEPSVFREAKKRLSERWASVVYNGINQEKKQVRRSSRTLGEMLAKPKMKKEEESCRRLALSTSRSCGGEEDLRASASCLSSDRVKDTVVEDNNLRNLTRSKSVPVSSSAYEQLEVKVKASDTLGDKPVVSKEVSKPKSGKSSLFRGKVSSLFFSRNKKLNKDNSIPQSTIIADKMKISTESADMSHNGTQESHKILPDDRLKNVADDIALTAAASLETVNKCFKSGSSSLREALALEKNGLSHLSAETQDQPSPISVLEAPFVDVASSSAPQSSESICSSHPQALSRSAPIESLARTLSWDDCQWESSSGNNLRSPKLISTGGYEQEEERSLLLEKLFSLVGFGNENWNVVYSKWHCPDCPLDPRLVDAFLDRKVEEAKSRERRSNQRLLFDCVNAALLDMGQSHFYLTIPLAWEYRGTRKATPFDGPVVVEVCRIVGDLFASKLSTSDCENGNVVVDLSVREEIGGRGWDESIWWEMYEMGTEIGEQVLDELFIDTLKDHSGTNL